MYLILQNLKKDLHAKHVIHPVVSFGMPKEIMKGNKGTWILKMVSDENAEDAALVLKKYIQYLWPYYGSECKVTFFPDISNFLKKEAFVTKEIVGRAET